MKPTYRLTHAVILALFFSITRAFAEEASNSPDTIPFPCDAAAAKAAQKRWATFLKRNVVETNSLGMKLTLIPPGEFVMGAPKDDKEFSDKPDGPKVNPRAPQHKVRITKPFYIGIYPVTQGEYDRLMGPDKNPSWFRNPPNLISGGIKGVDTNVFPVDSIDWNEAQDFCKSLSKREGRHYRLPTEAEWEYACRAGTATPFNIGPTLSSAQANFEGNKHPYSGANVGPNIGRTCAVGSYLPNAFGVHDMHGNVSQWCQDWSDWLHPSYYDRSPIDDPQGPSTGTQRVTRGGRYDTYAAFCRSSYRESAAPDWSSNDNGFRVVMDPQ